MHFTLKQLVAIGTLLMICSAVMAENVVKSSHASRAKSDAGYDTLPFDDTQTRLPPNYKGHSIKLFQETVLQNPVFSKGKTEFETNEAFIERAQNAFQTIKFGKAMDTNSKWAFMASFEDHELNYDPNRKGFTCQFRALSSFDKPWRDPQLRAKLDVPSLLLDRKSRKVRSYAAENAFGASGLVQEYRDEESGLSVAPCKRRKGRSYLFDDSCFIPMPPDQAEAQRSNLRLLLIARSFNFPYVYKWEDYRAPTFPELIETKTITVTTLAELDSIWVYNMKTGEIIEQHPRCSY